MQSGANRSKYQKHTPSITAKFCTCRLSSSPFVTATQIAKLSQNVALNFSIKFYNSFTWRYTGPDQERGRLCINFIRRRPMSLQPVWTIDGAEGLCLPLFISHTLVPFTHKNAVGLRNRSIGMKFGFVQNYSFSDKFCYTQYSWKWKSRRTIFRLNLGKFWFYLKLQVYTFVSLRPSMQQLADGCIWNNHNEPTAPVMYHILEKHERSSSTYDSYSPKWIWGTVRVHMAHIRPVHDNFEVRIDKLQLSPHYTDSHKAQKQVRGDSKPWNLRKHP